MGAKKARLAMPETITLVVEIPAALMRRIRIEKADTNRTIRDLVIERLQLSYVDHPRPLGFEQAPAEAP